MTINETAFKNEQYATILQVHIGILRTGLLLGGVKICHRVTVIDYVALFQNISFCFLLSEYACRLATNNGIIQAVYFYPDP
jgi:hypothetical protein